jgi:prepilin-type N-terminal cleavage/methylation domain-containing protein
MKKKNVTKIKAKRQPVQKRGFTLIEILVVATIIIVVAAIGLVSYSGAQASARDAKRAQDLENVRTTLLLFRTENGYYPIAGMANSNRIAFSFPRQAIARLVNAFQPLSASAALIEEPPPEDEESGEKTPTPTPVPEPGGEPTPTLDPGSEPSEPSPTPEPTKDPGEPTPVPEPGSPPEDKLAYQVMITELVSAGYFTTGSVPNDPINDNTYYYGYGSNGADFALTARLEKDGSIITLTN